MLHSHYLWHIIKKNFASKLPANDSDLSQMLVKAKGLSELTVSVFFAIACYNSTSGSWGWWTRNTFACWKK